MTHPLRIGIAGLGTVGAATVGLLQTQAELIAQRCGRPLVVTAVSARDSSRDRGVDLSACRWHQDAAALAAEPEVDVVVELIGGDGGIARAVCETALAHGKPVVTANKALLAHHGAALAGQAEQVGVTLAYEAAVAGGIPVIKGVRDGLAANRIQSVFGILNGTCNYILSEMEVSGRGFDEVLADAQELGYAEADPSIDVDGIDAAHKLAILAGLAFNGTVAFESVFVEGIRHVSALDIRFAEALGYRIKLLGLARRLETGVDVRVHPCLVPRGASIAAVDGVFNAVAAQGDFVGPVTMVGRGAGAGPTASAVVADLIDIARGQKVATLGTPVGELAALPVLPVSRRVGAYYLRLMVLDQPGVIAEIAASMRDHSISVESLLQRGRAPGEPVPVVIITHETEEGAMAGALAKIADIDAVIETPRMIRIEPLPQ